MTNDDRVYSIGLKSSSHSYALTDLRSDQFHGVHCLKGVSCSPNGLSWFEGKRVYIPVIEIAAITEYESRDDFVAACELANAARGSAPTASPASRKTGKRSKAKKRR